MSKYETPTMKVRIFGSESVSAAAAASVPAYTQAQSYAQSIDNTKANFVVEFK